MPAIPPLGAPCALSIPLPLTYCSILPAPGPREDSGQQEAQAHGRPPRFLRPPILAQSLAPPQATEERRKLTSCCWFCLQGTKLRRWGIQPLASAGEGGDTLCGPGALPGPYQPQESQHLEDLGCHLSARPWRVQGYFSGLGEDSSLYPVGTPGSW